MKMLVISHTPHLRNDRAWYGWGPTVREINFLSEFFSVVHIAPEENRLEIPPSYGQVHAKIKYVPTRNRGGKDVMSKWKVFVDSFRYAYLVFRELKYADIIHVRCPANISLIALCILALYPKKKKWIKYAGDWRPRSDFLSYRIQRYLIRNVMRNHIVSINGSYPDERPFVHHLLNPSYLREELASAAANEKPPFDMKVNLLFVGGLTANKGADVAIRCFSSLKGFSRVHTLYVLGDGPERDTLTALAETYSLSTSVIFAGWKPKDELKEFYKMAHFILLPSKGEGWPKVISEAMSFGVVPIVSDVSGIKATLERIGAGCTVQRLDPECYSDAVRQYLDDPARWMMESKAAMVSSDQFTFENWYEKLSALFTQRWSLSTLS